MDSLSFMFIVVNSLLFTSRFSSATDTLTSTQSLADGGTLISKHGSFELGFFSPGSSRNRYLGIWYKNIPVRTVVWVANRRAPTKNSTALLMIDIKGNLVLKDGGSLVWSTNSKREVQTPLLQLLDSGNLVLTDASDGHSGIYLWQSFDYPTDTLLPGMKLGVNLKTGFDRRLTSWKNWDDPSPGDFVWKILVHNNPEPTMWKGSKLYFRSGPWNGITYSGTPQLKPNQVFSFNFVHSDDEVYYTYYPKNKSVISRFVMNQTNYLRELYIWDEASQSWSLFLYLPTDYCDRYGLCGAYGNCIITDSPVCQCLKGFNPKSPDQWNSGDWSQGCVRNKSLNCQDGDGFIKFTELKLPDTKYSWVNKSMSLEECRGKCLNNCNCTAYSVFDIRNGGSGCALWFNDLIDIRQIPSSGQDLYIRMSASELARLETEKDEPDEKIVAIVIPAIVLVFAFFVVCYYFCQRRLIKLKDENEIDGSDQSSEEDLDLPLFDLVTISHATNKFSLSNRLGRGGFGPVYKGILADGHEIAVKRLSSNSGQGLKEFKNEVKLIARLQHRNLVKLLGSCIQGNERMLIYEYMPNKSLDFFIFDFGMAKTFREDQTEGNTKRVAGTYGYMAPEYATDGLFSVKSDVFSFGILILEIISGQKSRGFYHPNHSLNLIGYAWRLWKEGSPLELAALIILDSCHVSEVIRCIHISLLCVQQHAEDRPSMASVVLMLGSETALLPQPKEPGFFKDKGPTEAESSSSNHVSWSTNEISVSVLEAR
ncbi:receptor-like serine/threonine-protein kinase SD1-8 isoform X3 [Manihot esculenta]|uniref:receptor-like serine/threonine-protein kinase SD1-8 isoform X3 n=1 Tax=Manihot esculenta TaxID=3983 RepID=UPI001CC507D6|nr:receptor-like serine/threonine-protein kinase SD1-8 isoform X3 [Manihot esculenta]